MVLFFMKKRIKVIGVIVCIIGTLSSCSNEAVELVQPQLLKTVVEVSVDGTSTKTTLNYDGNKIQSIDKADAYLEFSYTEDLITKIINKDKVSKHANTLQYSYTQGKLVKIVSSDNYVINYIHNDDNTVYYEKVTKDVQNKDVKIYHGTLYFQNDNLVKDEQVLDNIEPNISSKKSLNVVYDNKINAMRNVLGFSKLLDYSKSISANNPLNYYETSTVKHISEDQIISAFKLNKSTSKYDVLGYPVEIESEYSIFGENNPSHSKSLLFYN
jgi:hypothetical protein